MTRYDIHQDVFVDVHPQQEIIVPQEGGEYVRYEDVIAMLEKIKNYDPDMSPREAIINYIFDDVAATNEESK